MNIVIQLGAGSCEIWNGEQLQTGNQVALAKFLGIPPNAVRMNMIYAGGSFGRRGNFSNDYHLEAAAIAKAAGLSVPMKLVRTREDDMRAGFYRPMYVHSLAAGLDANNRIVGWRHRIVGQSVVQGTMLAMMIRDGIDPTSVEGAANLPYDIPNVGWSCIPSMGRCRCSSGGRLGRVTPRMPLSVFSMRLRALPGRIRWR